MYQKLSYRKQIARQLLTQYVDYQGYGSLNIIGNGTIRQLAYEFLLAFHSNYGASLYPLRDSELLVENRDNVYSPPVFSTHEWVTPSEFCEDV